VLSLLSSAYVPYTTATPLRPWEAGITWQTVWSNSYSEIVDPYAIGSHSVIKYTLHHFVGIDFSLNPTPPENPAPTIDATNMSTLHVDVWTPNPPGQLQIQLVQDPGGPGYNVTFYNVSGLLTQNWNSLEVPLSWFNGMPSFGPLNVKDKLGQMLFLALDQYGNNGNAVIYVDNIYLHN
jgi:hypothetical protein